MLKLDRGILSGVMAVVVAMVVVEKEENEWPNTCKL
jgi:hypothetical protein